MEPFEIPVGPSQRQLRIEPQSDSNTFKIFAVDTYQDWIDHEQARSVDIPADGLLGTIKIKSERDFTFDGVGAFSGDELLGIAAQIVRHPSYGQPS
ncbi:hypothetical protein KHS38_09605 [Mucilaginibacter sp. Bleaf8]|uniref:hypothetical protein n=1 Tax=Mucilaginibacter sp. Bleaf8 TaxID=2834430 RepID=UPI001BD190F8|nr:hypothetical protein [Mucilaginibacter sp. Bleaf8]MBS7564658.1 hypothetical protein [Mucilaginibacter sp. Bleaf8]